MVIGSTLIPAAALLHHILPSSRLNWRKIAITLVDLKTSPSHTLDDNLWDADRDLVPLLAFTGVGARATSHILANHVLA
jgi:hypothetical protein